MKIIKQNDISVYIKSSNEYVVKTPMGNFTDINEAVKHYPYLSEHKNIRQCPLCKKWFIKYGKGKNRQKYCSKECSEKYIRIYKNVYNSAWNRDKWLRESNKQKLRDKYNNNTEYNQNDVFWGVGESHLTEHMSNNEEKERNLVRKELRRIYSRKKTNKSGKYY